MTEKKMTPREFCFWLQGALEVSGEDPSGSGLGVDAVGKIAEKLDSVFTKDEVAHPSLLVHDDGGVGSNVNVRC